MKRAAVAIGGVGLAIQLVPYGRNHDNPPVVQEPVWSSPQLRQLAVRACFDCHSNTTTWPWYSHVAPVSWLVQHDTEDARSKLNFSEWNRPQKHADEAAEAVSEGEMPMLIYVLMHSRARLTDRERQQLIDGLTATFGPSNDNPGRESED